MDGSAPTSIDSAGRLAAWFGNPKVPMLVKQQIRGLLKGGLVDPDKLDVAIQACDIAGKPERAHAFLTATHYLSSQGVDVADTLRMAQAYGRKISPDWGVKRWKDEHDKMGRVATMHRLREAAQQYDLARYDALLPSNYPGYLIRTSRRLGMEGLRQQHCVASYASKVSAGTCGIASVFAQGQRWTVELAPRQGVDLESGKYVEWLEAIQIKGKRNRDAPPEISSEIKWALRVEGPPPGVSTMRAGGPEEGPDWREGLRVICTALREHGVKEVHVSFDGSGDSGTIEGAEITQWCEGVNPVPNVLETVRVNVDRRVCAIGAGGRPEEPTFEADETTLAEAIERYAEHWTEESGVNWYDDDGGYGSITINASAGIVECEVYFRTSDAELGASDEIDVFADDDAAPEDDLEEPDAAVAQRGMRGPGM